MGRQFRGNPGGKRSALQGEVVVDHQDPIPRHLDIQLHPVHALFQGQAQSFQGVFPSEAGSTAVAEQKGHASVYNGPMSYEEKLRTLKEVTLAELKGSEGLLAVTEEDLIFIDDSGVHRLALATIKRIVRGEGGRIAVMGEGGSLEIPLKAFPMDELRLFLEGLKTHVARARRKIASPETLRPRPPLSGTGEEPAAPQGAPLGIPPTGKQPASPSEKAPSSEPMASRESVASPQEPVAEAPKAQREARKGGNPLALLSRLLALLSLGYGLAFALLNPVDPWVQLGVVLASLNFTVLLWSSGSSPSS